MKIVSHLLRRLIGEREGDRYHKKVRDGRYRQFPSTGPGEGVRNGKAQAAATVGTAGVPTDKAFGVVDPGRNLSFRRVFNTGHCCAVLDLKGQIDPGTLQSVGQCVLQQVLKDPVKPISVCGDGHRLLR